MIVCMSANTSWYLYNFRRDLIITLIAKGHTVVTVAPYDRYTIKLKNLGCKTSSLYIDNKGVNPFKDICTFVQFLIFYLRVRPDVAANFTIKPVVYGSLAALLCRIRTTNTITGLGTTFLSGNTIKWIVQFLLRLSLRASQTVFFQNNDDKLIFLKSNLVEESQAILVQGSGVNLSHFSYRPLRAETTNQFVLVSRMLWDKGIGEFVDAARIIKRKYVDSNFMLVGPSSVNNRTAISDELLDEWMEEGIVEYCGMVDDVREILSKATCVVLPSYREGLSRILMEACAIGRPIITTDVPGCRDVVTHGYNGLICRPRDSDSLARMIQIFLELPIQEKQAMGRNSRIRSEKKFDEKTVNQAYLAEFERK